MVLLPISEFVTSNVGHSENIDSKSYADLLNFDTFYYTVERITFINTTTDFYQTVL